jgi:hypothetical protein
MIRLTAWRCARRLVREVLRICSQYRCMVEVLSVPLVLDDELTSRVVGRSEEAWGNCTLSDEGRVYYDQLCRRRARKQGTRLQDIARVLLTT